MGNLLDPYVQQIRATASASYPAEKSRPHVNVRVYKTSYTKVEVRFNKNSSRKNFDIENILDTCDEIPIHDLWVHRLLFRFKYKLGPFDFEFVNSPLTGGSEAERWVAVYLKTLKDDGLISRAQLRHLPLISAMSVPRGGYLDGETLDDPSFVRWLSRATNGLVKMKTVRRGDEETFIDVGIKEAIIEG